MTAWQGEWTCCVEKETLRAPLPQDHRVVRSGRRVAWIRREKSAAASKIEAGDHSAAERWRAIKMEACQRLSHRERNATPEPFRDLLVAMAGTVKMKSETG